MRNQVRRAPQASAASSWGRANGDGPGRSPALPADVARTVGLDHGPADVEVGARQVERLAQGGSGHQWPVRNFLERLVDADPVAKPVRVHDGVVDLFGGPAYADFALDP